MRVRFLQQASVRGVPYWPGDEETLEDSTARVYIACGQCKQIRGGESDSAAVSDPSDAPKPKPVRQTARRGGKKAETAAKSAGEQR